MLILLKRQQEIALEYYESIYSFCMAHLGDETDAKDVAQETFLTFVEKAEELDEANIRSWLFSTANFKIKEKYRDRKIQTKFVSFDENYEPMIEVDFYDGEEEKSDDDIDRMKEMLLKKLSPEEYELFVEIYEKKKKYSEIGKYFGISQKNVSMRAVRLKKKILKLADFSDFVLVFVFVKLKMM